MSACAGEELSAGGKRTCSSLRPFVDRHEKHQLPVIFFVLAAPSLALLFPSFDHQPHPDEPLARSSFTASMAIEYIGLSAVGWHVMTKRWWNLLLAGLTLFGIVSALIYAIIVICQKAEKRRAARKGKVLTVPKSITTYLEELSENEHPVARDVKAASDPKTFGVYLGSCSNPPTPLEASIFKEWDVIVVDPTKPGINCAISSTCTSSQILGRVDIASIADGHEDLGEDDWIGTLTASTDAINKHFAGDEIIAGDGNTMSRFTGVLLANWQRYLPPIICRELTKYIKGLNFDVYLEAAEPDYLTDYECRNIGMDLIKGLVCRNGTIKRNGDRKDYYQMASMRRAQRALAKHMSLGGIVFAMWETVDDNVGLSYAVVNRSFLWCRFNTALSWIGTENALTDAVVAVEKTQKGLPLGALMWMKTNETMAVHDTWRLNDTITRERSQGPEVYDALEELVPKLKDKLTMLPPLNKSKIEIENGTDAAAMEVVASQEYPFVHNSDLDPLSYSVDGDEYTGLGCFQTGLPASRDSFNFLRNGQRRLRELNMLSRLAQKDLQHIGEKLRPLRELIADCVDTSGMAEAVEELLDLLAVGTGEDTDRLRIYTGIHSGFHRGTQEQFWGLYDTGQEPFGGRRNSHPGFLDLFISLRAIDRPSTVLHTWLSMKQFTRTQCLKAEWILAQHTEQLNPRWRIHVRLVQDIEGLSSQELILLLQRLTSSRSEDSTGLVHQLEQLCRHQLLVIPTRDQLRKINNAAYLQGSVSVEELIEGRMAWYRDQGCHAPDKAAAIEVFKIIDNRLPEILLKQEAGLLERIEALLQLTIKPQKVDAAADIFALAIFCAFRKLAVEEVYLEILDRNPLPNRHPDQAACFAEMFATGSQCETYFDMTSNVLGRILRDKYQQFYMKHQPPVRKDGSTELPTSYASKSIDEDPDAHRPRLPAHYQITFLGIFAVPALVDIVLLTVLGRGLYLSNYMSETEKRFATGGLMSGLLLTGGVGTWIGYGGSYYLHAMSFPAMNMFVLTRFTAGLVLLSIVSLIAFIIIGIVKDWYAGFIYVFYLVTLNTYLTTLATLAIYQFPGFMFQSGRSTVVLCLPLLLISPIMTLWVHHDHDIIIYPCVVSGFLICLLFGTREVIAKWGTWYLKVPIISDTEVVNFYMKVTPKEEIPDISDLAATPLPRRAFFSALEKERNKKPWQKSVADPLILKHVAGYDATVFLMDWYCKYSRTAMPYPYSPTWNLMVKTAIDTLKDMQKGLKLHNAFIHWRFGGDEVWCGVLYFLIALMDKWIALTSGAHVVGLSNAGSPDFRISVGFSLAYYLLAAVCLDYVAQPLWPKANKKTDQQITSLAYLKEAAANDAKARRKLYWVNFVKFFLAHIWGFALTTAMVWTFDDNDRGTVMYIAYVASYTGLLLYQYNRIYCGPLAMNDLIFSAIAGFVVGHAIRGGAPEFAYAEVTALACSTWIAAIFSWRTANVGWPRYRPKDLMKAKEAIVYSFSSTGTLTTYSQRSLGEIFGRVQSLPSEKISRIDVSSSPGLEAMQLMRTAVDRPKSKALQEAFPNAGQILDMVTAIWASESVLVDVVSVGRLIEDEKKLCSIVKMHGEEIHIIVFTGRYSGQADHSRNIAEAVLTAIAAAKLGLSRDDAALAGALLADFHGEDKVPMLAGVRQHIDFSSSERERSIRQGHAEILRYSLLGLDCDLDWDTLPSEVRSFLLDRCLGQDCTLTKSNITWLLSTLSANQETTIEQLFARYNLAARLAATTREYALARSREYLAGHQDPEDMTSESHRFKSVPIPLRRPQSMLGKISYRLRAGYKGWRFAVKYIVLALTADPEYQRELDFFIQDKPLVIRWPARIVLNGLWVYCKGLQSVVVPLFMFHRRDDVALIRSNMRGIKSSMRGHRVVTESYLGPTTGFLKAKSTAGTTKYHLYKGRHEKQPADKKQLLSVSTYTYEHSDTEKRRKLFRSRRLRLTKKEEFTNGERSNVFDYEYAGIENKKGEEVYSLIPLSRHCSQGDRAGEIICYDERGYVTSGSYWKDENLIKFKYFYRSNAKYDDELIRAEFELNYIHWNVSWCYPPPIHSEDKNRWIPNSKVTEASYQAGLHFFECKWNYDHRSHPTIHTTRDGDTVATPDMVKHDWYGILKKPRNQSFLADNPLFSFKNRKSNFIIGFFDLNTKWYPISTSAARNHLWRAWKGTKDLDAVSVRWLDENSLRNDSVLTKYWFRRDFGLLRSARAYFHLQADAILARTDLDPEVSSWSSIAFKYGDLDSFGQGGDARINTRSVSTQLLDTDEALHVLAMDTGTWPNEGGGVSACRRDMVNDLSTIRWHVIAENANDFGVPKFQTERNIQSLTVLPLWGMDFLTPNHGVFQDILDSAVQRRSNHTYSQDIRKNFLPILDSLVKCARAIRFGPEHIEEASRALVDLSNYFEEDRHWTETWMSEPVKQRWRELWLADEVENATPIGQWWDAELPSLAHLDNALDMWHRFLFIFTLPVPERIPDVFQASHHFAGASYGVLCKLKKNCTLHVWDHCISWREVTVFLSSAMSFDAPFVCTSLVHLSRMTSTLILHYADVVLPCADFFNPGWEVEHGTQEGILEHRKIFARKIDPVVNGICNMAKFIPIKKIKSKIPTVVMLSHVRFVKDIKNAILAADIIVNEWGFKDYQLDVYGDMEKAPAYSVECKEILASKGLRDHVALKGLGSPSKVLEEAWIFLNSSVSEGLPLAMGEAALTGVPVVCTDVGASFRVVTDPVTWKKFSAVVAPNDSYSLAKAQINVMGLLDEWSEYAEDEPGINPKLSLHPTKEEVAMITKRMYEKEDQRRKLGMMGRANVLNSFSSDRYLREHEQMLWIGKSQSPSYLSRLALASRTPRLSLKHEEENKLDRTRTESPGGTARRLTVGEEEGGGAYQRSSGFWSSERSSGFWSTQRSSGFWQNDKRASMKETF